MATVEMQESSFNEIIEGNNLVIIDFWAEWCGPCRAYAPVFERVSEEFPDVVFAKVDTEVEQALAGSFGIRSIPTTIAFKEGIGVPIVVYVYREDEDKTVCPVCIPRAQR